MNSQELTYLLFDGLTLNINKFHSAYMKSQHWSVEKAREEQLNKLRWLSDEFSLGIQTWKDFYNFPLSSKDTIQEDSALYKYGASVRHKKMIEQETSGSIGEPRTIYLPEDHWKRKEAVFMRNWKWLGWDFQPVLRLGPAKRKWWWYDWCRNVQVLDRKIITNVHRDWVLANRPFLIHGRGGGIMETCTRVIKEDPEALKNTKIFWCGEDPASGREQLKSFTHSFYEGYGLAELAPAAGSCQYGNMHVNMDCGIVEVIKGEIYVTDIDNDIQPIIRYKTGDEGKLRESDCPCRNQWDILYDVKGRRTDYYDGPEVKNPIHWWLVAPLGHPPYAPHVKAWRVEVYPKKGQLIAYVVLDEHKKINILDSYKTWVKDQSGLDCIIEEKASAKNWKRDLVRVYI